MPPRLKTLPPEIPAVTVQLLLSESQHMAVGQRQLTAMCPLCRMRCDVPEDELLPYHPNEAGLVSLLPHVPQSRMDALIQEALFVATNASTTTRHLSNLKKNATGSSARDSRPQRDATAGSTWVVSAGLEASRRRRALQSWLEEYAGRRS
jgi:hypothetical protein